jgi:hypothetical protein
MPAVGTPPIRTIPDISPLFGGPPSSSGVRNDLTVIGSLAVEKVLGADTIGRLIEGIALLKVFSEMVTLLTITSGII